MTTIFRRFNDPSYPNAPTLVDGASIVSFEGVYYGRLNVKSGGIGAADGSAYVDDFKSDGPNAETFFVAFGEDATSSHANRGLKAIALNTDYFDDLFHRDIAIPVMATQVISGSPVSQFQVPAGTFVGNTGGYPVATLFSVVDGNDNEIIDGTGATVRVTSISGAAIGDGFSSGTVTVHLSPSIPAGTLYKIYYATRTNLARLPVDAFSFIKIRGAEEIPGDVEGVFFKMQGPISAGLAWNATPTTTLWDLAYGGLDARYRRATARDTSVPGPHPVSRALDTAGSGSWFLRDSVGMVGYSLVNLGTVTGHQGVRELGLGSTWTAFLGDTASTADPTQRAGISSGFTVRGRKQTSGTVSSGGSLFAFLHTAARDLGVSSANSATNLIVGTGVALTGGTATFAGGSWLYKDFGGGNVSSIARGYDLIRVSVAGVIHELVITGITNATTASVRYPDGSTPTFSGPAAGILVDWQSTIFAETDGAAEMHAFYNSGNTVNLRGMFYACPPPQTRNNSSQWFPAVYAKFFGQLDGEINTALAWGGYDDGPSVSTAMTYVERGFLRGDGSLDTTQARVLNLEVHQQTGGTGNTGTMDVTLGQRKVFSNVTSSLALTLTNVEPGQRLLIVVSKTGGLGSDTVNVTATDTSSGSVSNICWNADQSTSLTDLQIEYTSASNTFIFEGECVLTNSGKFLFWTRRKVAGVALLH